MPAREDEPTPIPVEPIMQAIFALSDCLLASHPDTPRTGTVPEMMLAAVDEITQLRAKLALWEKLSRPEELAEARKQAQQPLLAAKQVYINAMEHYIAHLSAEYVVMSERAIHAEHERDKVTGLNVEYFMNCPPDDKLLDLCAKAERESGETDKPLICLWCWRDCIKHLAES